MIGFEYISKDTYFSDMAILDNRIRALEHIIDNITKERVEALKDNDIRRNNENDLVRSK